MQIKLALGYKTNGFVQPNNFRQTVLPKLSQKAVSSKKLPYSPIASFIFSELSKAILPPPVTLSYLPIILGETHYTANAPLALYYHSDMLRKNGVTILARETGCSTEICQHNLNILAKIIPALQEDIREIMDVPNLSKPICDKLSLWLTDSEVKNFLKSSMFDDEEPPFEERVEYYPPVMRFGKELESVAFSLLKSFSNNKEKLREIYYSHRILDINPLDIATIFLQQKGFEYHSIDRGRDYITKITGSPVLNDGMILRDQGMIEEIQSLQRKHCTNVIGVIGLFHMIGLETNYPKSAIYKDITGAVKLSLEDIRYNKKITFEDRYVKNIPLHTCLEDAFHPKNPDASLIEPATEVLEVLYRLTQSKKD